MAQERLMATAARLSTSLEALAALAAHIRLESEGLQCDPRVRDLLAEVASELLGGSSPDGGPAAGGPVGGPAGGVDSDGGGPAGSVDGAAGSPVVGMTRALLHQAAELVDNPGRSGSWEEVDEGLLQGYGRMSMAIVDAVQAAEGTLSGLADRLRTSGCTFLDVGTGTGWLAIAVARAYPSLAVVGIDIFEPALDLAQRNLASEGMTGRVTLQLQDVASLDAPEAYDVIWLPLPFMPADVVRQALETCARALRPGGWVLPGTFAGPPGRLSQLLLDVRTVRAGGHPWRDDDLLAVLASAGFADVGEVPRTWTAPVRLYAGRRP